MEKLAETLERISAKKAQLDAAQPLSPSVVNRLHEQLDVEWTYHSNAIEGNTLTLRETQLVLQHGLTVNGKPLREHLEAINHQHAIHFVEKLAHQDEPVTEHTIRSIHALVLRTIDDEAAGSYRRVQVYITGSEYKPPEPIVVPGAMGDLNAWLNSHEAGALHPVERAAVAHFRLVHIHPFTDGNGRTARLLMNLLLMRAGYPPAVIRVEDRLAYYDALDTAHEGNVEPLVTLVAEAVERSLDVWLASAEERDE
ncbi:MAG: Fic family protein [Chloroflexi bacterium]|nr:MAG: Fic family protein [Chloroflexota bacterium]